MIDVQIEHKERVKRHVSVAERNPAAAASPTGVENDNTGLPAVIFFYFAVFGLSAWNVIRVVSYLLQN
jgi:hypothetical protein